MARRSAVLSLTLAPRPAGTPAGQWLYQSLRSEILDGRLRAGSRLPSTRDLAKQYQLSRGTVVGAFEQLRSEGYVEGTVGSGTYVARTLPDELLGLKGPVVRRSPAPHRHLRPRPLSGFGRQVSLFPAPRPRPLRAFRANQPALDLFPTTLWAQVAGRRLRQASTGQLLGCAPMGYRPLREAVADYVSASRGVKCSSDQIAIVSGVQEATHLAARLFLDPGDRVAMENPGYIGAALLFQALGATVVSIPLDQDGMKLRPSLLRDVRLVYLTPSHQYPLGITMSLARRLELLEWARQSGAMIFEDDYDGEYRFTGRPIPSLQGLDRNGQVLFAGSFNKVLFPSLRLGYLIVPPDLVDRVAAAISITARHAPLLEQAILADFITAGHFGRHLRRMREVYAERLSVLLDESRRQLDGVLEVSGIEAGLQTVGWLNSGMNPDAVVDAAAARDVEVLPLSRFTWGRLARPGLQIGFAAVDVPEIRRGVRDLAAVLETLPLPA
jgi:GntR family transcriptional regulator/MocR family aminotransferase